MLSPDDKRFIIRLVPGAEFHTHRGRIRHDDILGLPLGRKIMSHLGQPFVVLQPSTHDLIMNVGRSTTIMYPKEIGYALLKLGVGPGKRVIEAGTGSGALTAALAYYVRPDGRVYSYEVREEMQRLAVRNLTRLGLAEFVEFKVQDISAGFEEREVDALFLDVREPWLYLAQAYAALKGGGFFGALVPTTNQIVGLLKGLAEYPFVDVEVAEIILRFYKPIPERVRPMDRLTAHTGYLLFARKVQPGLAGQLGVAPEEDSSQGK